MKFKTRYNNEVPSFLRLLGCFGIENRILRFHWGELSFNWGLALKLLWFDHLAFNLHLGPINLFLYLSRDSGKWWNPDKSYGFTYFNRGLQCHWNEKCKIFWMPWNWKHVRKDYLNSDGSKYCDEKELEKQGVEEYWRGPSETTSTFPFHYVLEDGTEQNSMATIYGVEHEWR